MVAEGEMRHMKENQLNKGSKKRSLGVSALAHEQ